VGYTLLMISSPKKITVICGPTSTGKTSLGLEMAKELNAVLLSADSRQIYKFMDIGTGKIPVSGEAAVIKKPDHWIINGVPVYGYDLVTPDQTYSAYDFCIYGRNLINNNLSSGKNVIVVGGTGFYIDALLGRINSSNIPPDGTLRDQLNLLPLSELQTLLKKISDDVFNKIDNKNKVRIIRAIEKLTLPEQKLDIPEFSEGLSFVQIGLKTVNEKMFSTADDWTKIIWEKGLIKETQFLIDKGYESSAPLNGLIYKSAKDYINGVLTESSAIERIQFDIHAYIRRQLTWFKRNSDIHWFDISQMSRDQIKSAILQLFSV